MKYQAAAAALLLASMVAGCGGDDSSDAGQSGGSAGSATGGTSSGGGGSSSGGSGGGSTGGGSGGGAAGSGTTGGAAGGGATGGSTGGSPSGGSSGGDRIDDNVYTDPASDTTPEPTPDFGPDTHIFDPSMSMSDIQSTLNQVFGDQETDQMGEDRFGLLFMPGEYDVDVNVAYYMDVRGLGLSPEDVVINGHVHSEADWFGGNSTHNFWRSVANMAVHPDGGEERWAVSQAAPFRRMHIYGNLVLDDGGWSSGGFIADSIIDGNINSGSQQQWYTRDTQMGSWSSGVWNMFFQGVINPPSGSWPSPPYTVVEQTPVIREKPFLFVNDVGNFYVWVPDVRRDTQGPTWASGTTAGRALKIDQFYLAHPDTDDAASINAALDAGQNLLLTPGVYFLDDSIRVNRAGTVVLGLGLPSLQPQTGTPVIEVADVDGVKVAGILIDAGPQDSPTLLRVGEPGSSADHSAYPTSIHDVFCRIGGGMPGRASGCVEINSNHVIGDHFWLWRADHGEGTGWYENVSKNGLVVHGDDVTISGLFVEHFHEYQTLWHGEGGRVFFYQCEMPYDPASQDEWSHDGVNGYAGYKVADEVGTHEAWGIGVYAVFHSFSATADNAIEVPSGADGVRMHHMVIMSLGGSQGTVGSVINGVGGPATGGDPGPHTVDEWPVP